MRVSVPPLVAVCACVTAVDRRSVATHLSPRAPHPVVPSSFLEDDGEPEMVKGNTLVVPTGHRAVVTVKVRL